MKRPYKNIPTQKLRVLYNDKRRRIAELPKDDRLPADMEELLSMRLEIDLREKGEREPADVDFSKYITQ